MNEENHAGLKNIGPGQIVCWVLDVQKVALFIAGLDAGLCHGDAGSDRVYRELAIDFL